ncbi:MAG: hypothetical protein ACU0BS_09950 [Hasllibacter sp.]
MKKTVLALCAASTLAACATPPDEVGRAYVSPATFGHMNCRQLLAEEARLVAHVNDLTGRQQSQADNDAAMMAVGMILFWPALFALSAGSDHEHDLRQARGQHDAILAARQSRGC